MDVPDLLYGLSAEFIAQVARVSLHTARRWKQRGRVPSPARALLELRSFGDLGVVDSAWRGFVLRQGHLWTPHGFSVRPGELSALPYRFAQLAALEHERTEPHQWRLFR